MFLPRSHSKTAVSLVLAALIWWVPNAWCQRSEPPELNPFGPSSQERDDGMPGFLETSDGKVHPGTITLTRDARLKIFDGQEKKFREIPLKAVKRIDCKVVKEWMEKEWRFKENASDEKYFTGRGYPAREYTHTITLSNGRKIEGALSGIVYVRDEKGDAPTRYLLHKRDKGAPGTELNSLVYVRTVRLGPQALAEGKRKASEGNGKAERKPPKGGPAHRP